MQDKQKKLIVLPWTSIKINGFNHRIYVLALELCTDTVGLLLCLQYNKNYRNKQRLLCINKFPKPKQKHDVLIWGCFTKKSFRAPQNLCQQVTLSWCCGFWSSCLPPISKIWSQQITTSQAAEIIFNPKRNLVYYKEN